MWLLRLQLPGFPGVCMQVSGCLCITDNYAVDSLYLNIHDKLKIKQKPVLVWLSAYLLPTNPHKPELVLIFQTF